MNQKERGRSVRLLSGIGVAVLVATCFTVISASSSPTVASATTPVASNFNPGDIIDDSIFYNAAAMSQTAIQQFLQSEEPTCAPSPGAPGCLENYVSSTPARAASPYCAAFPMESNQLASQIIYDAAQACGINPQVILVTLQKEQGLVTTTNPSAGAYASAMGYACPDTSPTCVGAYAGFGTQVYDAAWQFEYYKANPTHFNYLAGQNNTILYVPASNTTCTVRSSVVYIQNQATAGLYDYTPYQPDAAALANLNGAGDACSSYGNRNFWFYFTTWFGSPTVPPADASFVQALYHDVLNRAPSEAEIEGWASDLASGAAPVTVASGFVNSDEYRLLRINAAYQNVLGRPAAPVEAQGWLGEMKAGALQTDDIDRTFYASQEFYNNSGPSGAGSATNETYVNALYKDLIGRAASPAEQEGWGQIVTTRGAGYVTNTIWDSVETARSRVTIMYQKYLGRTPSLSEVSGWAQISIAQGDAQVRWDITGSQEYWNYAQTRFPPSNS